MAEISGSELFYLSMTDGMMSVAVKRSGAELEFGVPKVLFQTKTLTAAQQPGAYDVTADGQRFLIGEVVGAANNANPLVVLNWPAIVLR